VKKERMLAELNALPEEVRSAPEFLKLVEHIERPYCPPASARVKPRRDWGTIFELLWFLFTRPWAALTNYPLQICAICAVLVTATLTWNWSVYLYRIIMAWIHQL